MMTHPLIFSEVTPQDDAVKVEETPLVVTTQEEFELEYATAYSGPKSRSGKGRKSSKKGTVHV